MQWLIDIIKKWVIAQAYATQAWVLAKLYLPKAEFPSYGMPVNVTGDLSHDATCTYFRCGDYNGKPCYCRIDGIFNIWWNGVDYWIISHLKGSYVPPSWSREDANVLGDYEPVVPTTGIATASDGFKYLLTSFVDRGDPEIADYAKPDLILDDAWHDMDLSDIVPAGAKVVLIRLFLKSQNVEELVAFRQKGNVNAINISLIYIQVAGVWNRGDCIVALDESRVIEYKSNLTGFVVVGIAVGGWWF